jgi:uncharacterized membrane protein YgdD (TMEM256/DUF423 family)
MKPNTLITLAATTLFLAVAAGAFGAHGLKAILSAEMLAIWQTAVHYQMVHGLALLFIALWLPQAHSRLPHYAAWAMLAGMLLFSGSLYALALSGIRLLGAITPLGGLALLLGWALLAWAGWRERT